MEILTLLRADIRRKKGTFFSIMFLMVLISAIFTSIISAQNNYQKAVNDALVRTADLHLFFPEFLMNDELREAMENSEMVGSVRYAHVLNPDYIKTPDGTEITGDSLTADTSEIRFYNAGLSGFEERVIKSGELYVPLGHKSNYGEIGDRFTVKIGENEYLLTLKGYVESPMDGASTIDSIRQLISMEDMDRMLADCGDISSPDTTYVYTTAYISKAEDCGLSSMKFMRGIGKEIKDKTGVTTYNTFAMDESYKYTTLLPDIMLDIVMVFAGFLFVVVLIVINHSVGSEIDADYTTIGVLKSQGFGSAKIRALYILRYILSMTIGMVVGFAVSVPVERAIGNACMDITGVLPEHKLSLTKSVILAVFMLVLCMVMIIFRTRRVAKLSPVRAISGGRREIYFHSRLHAPIAKCALSLSLAYRQVTSGLKNCVGVALIAAILTFFMVTANLFGNILNSDTTMNAMGLDVTNIFITEKENVQYSAADMENAVNEAEKMIDEKPYITRKNYYNMRDVFYEGEKILCLYYKYPEDMPNISEGRAPLYDNEVLITDMIAETYGLAMGDKVTFSYDDNDEEYLICGIFQQASNTGMVFGMNLSGGDRLGVPRDNLRLSYLFDDRSQLDEIEKELNERFGDMLNVEIYDSVDELTGINYSGITNALKLLIYAASLVFSFVTVRMVVSKAFVRERTDIGIYKAIGFTSGRLRLSFAVRFALLSLVGAGIGAGLSGLFSEKTLSAMLRLAGFSRVICNFDVPALLVPAAFITAAVFVFAYATSRKVRRVEVRELIVE